MQETKWSNDEIWATYINKLQENIVMKTKTVTILKAEQKKAKKIEELTKGLSPELARGIREMLTGKFRKV